MEVVIFKSEAQIADYVSKMFINQVKTKPKSVLGFATGSSPVSTYNAIIKDYQTAKTDWSQVVTFNLDEYVALQPTNKKSYYYFMQENLFHHINVNKNNINIPSGIGDLTANVNNYETKLKQLGPIDLQILGIGINGHIAFNEPGTTVTAVTHIVNLTQNTIDANKRFFASIDEVPKQAITMGIASILKAKKIVLVAQGANKAEAIFHLVKGKVSDQWPCSFLQNHSNVVVVVDEAAASMLK